MKLCLRLLSTVTECVFCGHYINQRMQFVSAFMIDIVAVRICKVR